MREPAGERHAVPDREGLYVFTQRRSRFYSAEAFIDGRKVRKSTRTDRLTTACKLAIDWHKRLLKESRYAVQRRGIDKLAGNPTIGELVDSYEGTLPASKAAYLNMKWSTIEPFWRTIEVEDVTAQTFRAFFKWRRARKTPQGTKIKNHSVHKDAMIIRQLLKYAIEEGHISALPLIPKVGKIDANPRPWLTDSEWRHLCSMSQERIRTAPNVRTREQRIDCDHFMRLMVASCGRVDEIRGIRFRDCKYRLGRTGIPDVAVISVTGKRGSRDLVAEEDAVTIISKREGAPDDLVFPEHHRDAFRELLEAAKLRRDKAGNTRNFKSLRATSISRQVLAGKDLLFIARNSGTSISMIDAYYARRLSAEMSIRESHPVANEIPASAGRE